MFHADLPGPGQPRSGSSGKDTEEAAALDTELPHTRQGHTKMIPQEAGQQTQALTPQSPVTASEPCTTHGSTDVLTPWSPLP